MTGAQLVLVVGGALLFLVAGSFVNVVIDRLPVRLAEPNRYGDAWDTRPWPEVLGGRSRCSTCGDPVRALDNIPVVSYLVLRGRCRGCGERIPAFHPAVELAAPLLYLGALWAIGPDDWRLLPALWLIPVGLAVLVIDLRTLIVPTRLVWPALAGSVALTVLAAAMEGEWGWLLSGAVGALALAAPLFTLWFVHPKGMGFGDVRLSVLLGWHVGVAAGDALLGAVILAMLVLALSAVVGIVLGVVALGARGRKAQVPFGPALVVATWFCVAFATPILEPFAI